MPPACPSTTGTSIGPSSRPLPAPPIRNTNTELGSYDTSRSIHSNAASPRRTLHCRSCAAETSRTMSPSPMGVPSAASTICPGPLWPAPELPSTAVWVTCNGSAHARSENRWEQVGTVQQYMEGRGVGREGGVHPGGQPWQPCRKVSMPRRKSASVQHAHCKNTHHKNMFHTIHMPTGTLAAAIPHVAHGYSCCSYSTCFTPSTCCPRVLLLQLFHLLRRPHAECASPGRHSTSTRTASRPGWARSSPQSAEPCSARSTAAAAFR
eukprot:354314-Chlamydomonas_euryale.AAC.12